MRTLALLMLALLAPPAMAAGTDALHAFFEELQSLEADFTQEVFASNESLQQRSKGHVIVQRPGKFRWDYRQPYAQHIVADGDKIWLYDVDLEQVTVKPQDQTMANTPASLLSGSGRLSQQFHVEVMARGDGDWFELLPKQADSGFESIFVHIKDNRLREMELQDSFGQRTRISFDAVVLNRDYPAQTFRLDIPQGVDVIDETAQ